MACAEFETTSAFLDGELSDPAAAEAERHIAGCAECQAFVEAAAHASQALHSARLRYATPPTLRARISRALDAESVRMAQAGATTRRRLGFWQGAASGVGASALAAAVALFALLPPSPQTLVAALADAHVDALAKGRTIAVVSSNHHVVKPWFAGRVPLSPPVTDFASQGFPLLGGRAQRVAGHTMAVLAYGHGKHEIDLFVWADSGAGTPAPGVRHGYHVSGWRSGDLDFAAVSDVQPEELARFVALARAEPE